ncbi:MAG: uroporphyrinogen decarboxylase family protein [Anaerolineae bacterium]
MMTSRQVVDALLRNGNPDRVGLMDSPWSDTIAQWVRQGYPTRPVLKEAGEERWNPEDGRQVTVEQAGEYTEPVPPFEHFGYDLASVGPWFDIMPLRDHSVVETETDDWEVRRNGAGAALKLWKHKSGTPEHIDFRMVTREIWERDYRQHLLALDPQRVDLPKMSQSMQDPAKADRWTHVGHMFVWELMRQSMGDVTMYESLVLDPGWVHDYCEVYTTFFQQHFAYIFEHLGLPCGAWLYEDLGYKNGLFASPRVLSALIFPYYRQMVDFFHSYDLPVVLHSCGSTAEALPLVIEAGFDAVNPMERKALHNDPFTFAERYGDRLAFVGGLDARVFESNDRDLIRREVTDYIQGMKARNARLVFASDHSISPNTHYDSYRYALDVYREHMMY